jgi:AbrB family looped-hinge helix DNA binding protein
MSELTVTAKGQVTLRKDLLQHLGVRPGDKIAVDKLPDGRIEVKAAQPAGAISDVFNFLKRKKKGASLSIDEINTIAAKGWARRR